MEDRMPLFTEIVKKNPPQNNTVQSQSTNPTNNQIISIYHFSYDKKETSKYENEELRRWMIANIFFIDKRENIKIQSPVESTIVFTHITKNYDDTIMESVYNLFEKFDEYVYSCFSVVRNLKFDKNTTKKTFRNKTEGDPLIEIKPKKKPTEEEFNKFLDEIYANKENLIDIKKFHLPTDLQKKK
jgi:hypothetical protein